MCTGEAKWHKKTKVGMGRQPPFPMLSIQLFIDLAHALHKPRAAATSARVDESRLFFLFVYLFVLFLSLLYILQPILQIPELHEEL